MTTSVKRPANIKPKIASKSAAAVRAKGAPKPAAATGASRSAKTTQTRKPFLRFYHSESLRSKTLGVLHDLETAEDGTVYRNALANLVVELTDSGMDYYFLRPLKVANAGFLTEQSANLGMAGTTRVLGSVIRTIIGRMDERQLLAVCGYIRQLMK